MKIFVDTIRIFDENVSMESTGASLFINQIPMARACLSVRTAALLSSVINPWPSFYGVLK